MRPTAVFWDLDGTLVDSEPLHERTLVRSLRAEGIEPPDDLHERVLGMPASLIHAHFAREHGLRAPLAEWSRLRCRHFVEQAHTLRPRPGAVDVFRALQALGVAQAVVSNSDRVLVDASLRAIGLAEAGLISVTRNDVRLGKPDPEPYRRAAWLLDVEPSRAVVVEDSATGASAGLAAGCRTLFWPEFAAAPPEGAQRVDDLAALRACLGLG